MTTEYWLEITLMVLLMLVGGVVILGATRKIFSAPVLMYASMLLVWLGLVRIRSGNYGNLPLWVHTVGMLAFALGVVFPHVIRSQRQYAQVSNDLTKQRRTYTYIRRLREFRVVKLFFITGVFSAGLYLAVAGVPLLDRVWQSRIELKAGLGLFYRLGVPVFFVSCGALLFVALQSTNNRRWPPTAILAFLLGSSVALLTGFRSVMISYTLMVMFIVSNKIKRNWFKLLPIAMIALTAIIALTFLYLYGYPNSAPTVGDAIKALWDRVTLKAAEGAHYLVETTMASGLDLGAAIVQDFQHILRQDVQAFSVDLFTKLRNLSGPNPGFAIAIAPPAYFFMECGWIGTLLGMTVMGLFSRWVWEKFVKVSKKNRAFSASLWAFVSAVFVELAADAPTPAKLYYTISNTLLALAVYSLVQLLVDAKLWFRVVVIGSKRKSLERSNFLKRRV